MTRLGPLLALALLAGACERPAAAPTTTQAARAAWPPDRVNAAEVVESERDTPCPRILSTAPNVTEICWALGLGACLVGRTRYCEYPPAAAAVPSIGDLNNLSVEVLLQLDPELILVSGTSRNIADRLGRLDLKFESLPDVSLADLFTSIERVGALTGRPATAARLNAALRADLDAVVQRYAATSPARVLLVLAPLPDPPAQLWAAGPGSFYDDLLRRAGHTNVAAARPRPFTPVSLEFILEADPDVIVELLEDAALRPGGDADARAAWQRVGPLRAVATGRIHVLAGRAHFILGPRVAQTAAALCATIAGDSHE